MKVPGILCMCVFLSFSLFFLCRVYILAFFVNFFGYDSFACLAVSAVVK